MIDAAHGFAYPAIDLAIGDLSGRALRTGIAAAGIHRSHHAGAVGRHAEALADHGLMALIFANTPRAMAAFGGAKPVFGTNPIAFACPRPDADMPVVIDMALSVVARGRIVAAAEKGEPIPTGWALDGQGRPTADAKAALAGALQPIGGAKGAALALMVEVLAACLTGATLAADASSFLDAAGAPPATGQLIVALAPDAFGGAAAAMDRVGRLAAMIESDSGAHVPGVGRAARRAAAARDGLTVSTPTLDAIDGLS
jgi:(2R)-3-sulfolactate dehydrogenase (NADP+)